MKSIMQGIAVVCLFWAIGILGSYEIDRMELGQAALWWLLSGTLFGISTLIAYILPEKKKRPTRQQLENSIKK